VIGTSYTKTLQQSYRYDAIRALGN